MENLLITFNQCLAGPNSLLYQLRKSKSAREHEPDIQAITRCLDQLQTRVEDLIEKVRRGGPLHTEDRKPTENRERRTENRE